MTYILNLNKYIKYTQAHKSIRTFGRIYYIYYTEHFGISLALLSHPTIMIILFKKFQIMYRNIQYNHI